MFKVDNEYQENEDRYKAIKEEILGEGSIDEEEGESDGEEESKEEEEKGEGGEMKIIIIDETQTDLLELRRTIYLTIMSRYLYIYYYYYYYYYYYIIIILLWLLLFFVVVIIIIS